MLQKPLKWLALPAIILIVGCGAADVGPTAEPTSVVIQTEGLEPTPTYTPAPTIQPTYTPYPTPDIEGMVSERLAKIMADQESMPSPTAPTGGVEVATISTPEPTATREPTATPEPVIRHVSPPASSASALTLASISIGNDRELHLSGTVNSEGHEPTVIQVFHSYDFESHSESCSTERPVAFIQKGNGSVVYTGQSSPYTWTFCTQYQKGKPQTDQVPWLYSQHWKYALRHRDRITDPYIYDFAASASLDHWRVEGLEYGSVAAGYRVVIWSGDTILASAWVEG